MAGTLYEMSGFTNATSTNALIATGIVQGVGIGLVFVALSTLSFTTLESHLRTSGTALLTLIRNLGSAIGISMMIAIFTSKTTEMRARLAEHITPFNDALKQADRLIDTATDQGRALLDGILTQQAQVIAYQNDFYLLMLFTLATMPFLLLIGSTLTRPQRASEAQAEI
jgi:DHA2 family multidrug resistance protein